MVEKEGILFESNQLLIVQKPAGIITEDNPFEANNLEANCRAYLKQKINDPYLGVVHRLDRVTSGVVIFAKKRGTLKTLNRWFEERQIQKLIGLLPRKPQKIAKVSSLTFCLWIKKQKSARRRPKGERRQKSRSQL